MNGRRRFLTASVISVQNSNFVYPSCQNCFSRLCLDLERYVEDLNSEAGEATRDTSPSVLIQAVETCFVGKKFIFGVKDSNKQDGASCRVKTLTACQVFVPNPGLVGCTVLHYLHQHQHCSRSTVGHGGAWSPSSTFTALDQPSGELSSWYGSGDQVFSGHTNCFSSLWPQSFGLASSSVSGGAAADPTALGLSRPACDEPGLDGSPFCLPHHRQSVDTTQDDNLTVNERNVQGDDKLCLCSSWRDSSFVTKDAQSHSSERDGCRSLGSPLEKGKKDSPGKISSRRSCGLEKSLNPLQSYSFCPPISYPGHSRDSGSSQGDSWFGDELPYSESLDEFIARIEKGQATVAPTETRAWGRFHDKQAGEIHKHVNWSPLQLEVISATSQAGEKPQEVAEKEDVSKEPVPSRHQAIWQPLSGKEYQQGASISYSSTQLSPAGIKPSGSKGSCPSSKEGEVEDTIGHENHPVPSSLKTAGSCRKGPVHVNCKREGNARNKSSSRYERKQTSDPTNVRGQGFTSAAHEKPDADRERQPFQEVHENNCEGGEISSLLRDSSICPWGGYNASADLFDASAAGVEVVAGTLSSAPGGAMAAKPTASGRRPSESGAGWNTSQNGLPFLESLASSEPKASTPVAGPAAELGPGLSDSRDFVPSSQSTPRVRPCQQARLPRKTETNLSELPLNRLPWIEAKWKRSRAAFKGPFAKQLVNKFLQSRRSKGGSAAEAGTSMTPGLASNGSLAQEPSGNDSDEWIPPSEKKWRQTHPFQDPKMSRLSKRKCWDHSPFSEKRTRRTVLRRILGLARTEFTPQSQQPTEASFREDVADSQPVMVAASSRSCTVSGGTRSNWPPTPRSTPNMANWSPELFRDNS
ncbi:DNA damage-induced apoptosis suppressor protein isoform X2 [Sphaerodactylus townsendi]|uniref:DNA damage-induced apoptosis suppressor protein isoform X2 n=1 Tax=Sphaerodactylus townsendi TaxID=933632 RepID=UPI0020268276|nr:DNA damage-induced apoptosis suppressor protein isoform X2 [Sphaerodactylus townsendi]